MRSAFFDVQYWKNQSTITETGKIAQLAAGVAIAAGPAATEMWRIGDWAVKTGTVYMCAAKYVTNNPVLFQVKPLKRGKILLHSNLGNFKFLYWVHSVVNWNGCVHSRKHCAVVLN